MNLLLYVLLALAILGSLSSLVFLGMAAVAARRFKLRQAQDKSSQQTGNSSRGEFPSVSILKPLHGAEPKLEQYLETFFSLDYPQYEILFCARNTDDPGLQLAQSVAARYPHIPVQFLTSGTPPWPNARCYSLYVMAPAAKNNLLVITDSDVSVRPNFLREVISPFSDPAVGASTCLYVGAASGMGLWGVLEGLGMSVEMSAGVLVADMLEGMRFTLGPAMIVRKSALAAFGGFERLGHYYADDFMLGNLVAASGERVVLSTHVVDHWIVHNSFARNFSHQWNWMKSTRFSRPLGHLGTVLTFATPFGLLGLAAAWGLKMPAVGISLVALAYLSRVILSVVIGGWAVGDRDAYRLAWLYPLRDFLGFVLWVASYTSREVGWRDDRFVLERGGLMEKIEAAR